MKVVKKIIRKLKVLPQDIYSFIHRDDIILYDKLRKTDKNRVNLHWCSENRTDGKENVGDYLAVPVFEYMKKLVQADDTKELDRTKHLYTIGSILFFGFQDCTVWGSGLLCKPKFMLYKPKLDIRMVRGPETKKILVELGYDCPEVYGDPAIIMPLIYTPERPDIKREYGVVLHKNSRITADNRIEIIRNDYESFIDEIVSSKRIISNSLHGIILAEAYGVPAVLLTDNRADFNLLKYQDYYYSTGRYGFPVAESVDEALKMTPPEIPDFSAMREKMISAFPADLWE